MARTSSTALHVVGDRVQQTTWLSRRAISPRRCGMAFDAIFQPLTFRNLTIKNRIIRSNISGRFDNYDGSGNQARINWEVKFAKGGVGAIVSSFVPVHLRGRIVPNYAMIDHDRHIPFWRALGEAVHAHDCKLHPAAQSWRPAARHPGHRISAIGLSSTDKPDPTHGFACERMTSRADPRDRRGLRAGRAARARSRARRRRAARRQRLPDHAVPQLRDQRSQGRLRRSRSRTAPASSSRSSARSARKSATTSTCR